jgi:hypothetical protein
MNQDQSATNVSKIEDYIGKCMHKKELSDEGLVQIIELANEFGAKFISDNE